MKSIARAWLATAWPRRKAAAVARAYRMNLNPHGEAGALILADLARFCHAHDSSFVAGAPDLTAHNEGMRAVWLHIARMANLSPEDAQSLYREVTDEHDA